jgi:hypothetical protein
VNTVMHFPVFRGSGEISLLAKKLLAPEERCFSVEVDGVWGDAKLKVCVTSFPEFAWRSWTQNTVRDVPAVRLLTGLCFASRRVAVRM